MTVSWCNLCGRIVRVNISNPGPVESWQEVLAEARDQITSATAVKARRPSPCNTPPGPSSSSQQLQSLPGAWPAQLLSAE